MSKSKKWIFVGDHKQLPPIQETHSELFKMSVFENCILSSQEQCYLKLIECTKI